MLWPDYREVDNIEAPTNQGIGALQTPITTYTAGCKDKGAAAGGLRIGAGPHMEPASSVSGHSGPHIWSGVATHLGHFWSVCELASPHQNLDFGPHRDQAYDSITRGPACILE